MRQEMPLQSHIALSTCPTSWRKTAATASEKMLSNFSDYPCHQPGTVLGLLGQNGIGKSTTLKVLSGEIKPNLGNFQNPPDWNTIIQFYRGSSLQEYFQKMSEGNLKISHKPQYVDRIPKAISGKVSEILEKVDQRKALDNLAEELELKKIWDRPLDILSGGELQRVAVTAALCREADVYLFDEPSSYLDVKQRLEVAKAIRSLKELQKDRGCRRTRPRYHRLPVGPNLRVLR